jgi:hypothetical protein
VVQYEEFHFSFSFKTAIVPSIRGVTMKFPEWFYFKHTCVLTAYWEGSPSKYSPSVAMHSAQRCCHCWKHFWNSSCGMTFSAVLTFLYIFNILKSSSLYGRFYFWKQPRVIRSQIRGIGWVFHFSNPFLGQKLTESVLWAGALSWWRIQSLDQSWGIFLRM